MIDRLEKTQRLPALDYAELIRFRDGESASYLAERAEAVRGGQFGRRIQFQGLIDLTSYCRNDCYYCGLRRENRFVHRYRMEAEDVLSCCETGYIQGIRSFLIQGGEDPVYTPDRIEQLVKEIRSKYPDCQVYLALGERSGAVYRKWVQAGMDGYILRYQTSDESYYKKLHPGNMSLLKKKQCLWELKGLECQLGTGFMIGTPNQKFTDLAQEMLFLKELSPQYIMVGPFISAANTPFESSRCGNVDLTCYLLSMLRLMFPGAILPVATTAAILERTGNWKGVQAGANMVLVDLTPRELREEYHQYSKRMFRGAEGREGLVQLREQLQDAGYEIAGDNIG